MRYYRVLEGEIQGEILQGTRGYSSTLVASGRSASSSSVRRSYSAIARREPYSDGFWDRIAGRGVAGAAAPRGLSCAEVLNPCGQNRAGRTGSAHSARTRPMCC